MLTPEWGEPGVTSCARATGVMSHMRTRRHLFGYYGVESTETIPYPSTKQNNVLMAVLQPKNAIGNAIAHGHGNHNLLNSNITTKRIGGVPLLTQRTLDRLRPLQPRGDTTTTLYVVSSLQTNPLDAYPKKNGVLW